MEHEGCSACGPGDHLTAEAVRATMDRILNEPVKPAEPTVVSPGAKLDAMRQERDRYRAALERIEQLPFVAGDIAREALEKTGG